MSAERLIMIVGESRPTSLVRFNILPHGLILPCCALKLNHRPLLPIPGSPSTRLHMDTPATGNMRIKRMMPEIPGLSSLTDGTVSSS